MLTRLPRALIALAAGAAEPKCGQPDRTAAVVGPSDRKVPAEDVVTAARLATCVKVVRYPRATASALEFCVHARGALACG